MYNEELKKKFIRSYTTSLTRASVCETTFNSLASFEEEWCADLCTQSKEVLQPAVDKSVGLKQTGMNARLLILKDYVRWCIATKVSGACDGMLYIDGIGIGLMREQTVSSPKNLQKYLDIICYPEDEKTTDNVCRVYYWLAYAGMLEEDIYKVTSDDVDFNRMVVTGANGEEFRIYPESIKAFKNCATLDYFVYKHPNYNNDKIRIRVDGKILLRGIRANQNWKSFRVELSRRDAKHFEKTGIHASFSRIRLSGVCFRAYLDEISGIKPDFRSVVLQEKGNVNYKLDKSKMTINGKLNQLTREYEEDYERWKLAWIYQKN